MNINKLLSLSLIAAAAFACQKEQMQTQVENQVPLSPVQMKAVNSSIKADPSSIMIFMDKAPSSELLEKWQKAGVSNVKRLFYPTPGKEEMQARFNLDKWYILKLDEQLDCNTAAEMLAAEKSVSRIQFNKVMEEQPREFLQTYTSEYSLYNAEPLPFNDPMLSQQWHLINKGDKAVAQTVCAGADVNVKDAWKLVTGDPELIVAVVDAGLMYTHPDLAPNIWVNPDVNDDKDEFSDDLHGACFVDGSDGKINWTDPGDSGHGTHVAGIIAAVNNNGVGIGSVAGGSGNNDGVKLMGCQIFRNGKTSEDAVAKAFQYAADHGACILQCSFGLDGGVIQSDNQYMENEYYSAVVDALNYFRAQNNYPALKGGMAIFASGNESQPYSAYPGALKDNICVTAIGPDYLPASYTNYGPGCNIAAPGGDAEIGSYRSGIISTVPNSQNKNIPDYAWMQGTSMACPNVTGVVALGMAYARKLNKVFTYQEMTDMVLSSVNDLDERMKGLKLGVPLDTYRKQMGTGTIDAWRLLMKIEGTPSITIATGRRQMVSLSDIFGTSAPNLTYLGIEIDEETKASLGLEEDPQVKNGVLYITPTKVGSGKVRISAIAGGENLGGGDSIGGMEISQEVSLIARSFKSSNGGWL